MALALTIKVLDETDVTGYDVIPSIANCISSFEERADTQDLLFITGSLFYLRSTGLLVGP